LKICDILNHSIALSEKCEAVFGKCSHVALCLEKYSNMITIFKKQKQKEKPFWLTKKLEEMSEEEWESLCDGCGRCCMHKLEDEDTGDIYATSVGCQLLDGESCQCLDYANRQSHVPDCIKLTRTMIAKFNWLPKDCAYKLVDQGKDLKWWHYLKSGSRETVHNAGISVRGQIKIREDEINDPLETLNYITHRIWKRRK